MKLIVSESALPEELEIFANLRTPRAGNHFIAESEKIVTRLLRSSMEISSIFLTRDHFTSNKDLIEAHVQDGECRIFLSSKEEMEHIVGFSLHQGILAAGKIPSERGLEELITSSAKPLLFVILDEVADAENMGSIIRTSQALNASAVIVDGKSVSPWYRRAVRVSMGAVFELPIITVESIADSLLTLRKKNIHSIAAILGESAKEIWDCDLAGDCAIVFGSEGHGIKKEIVELCDRKATIPMHDALHSLNVGTALGVFMYEASRQRRTDS
ncbi:MAG: RNA methyltransferase [Bacteroidota bacterium]|nr:RNA methyltransferase [Bacteroidota bacterium]MDP4235333.1 RNA methyltransferase [Bacteroidota bacterium]